MSISPRNAVAGVDELRDALLGPGVAGDGQAADLRGDRRGGRGIQVVHHDPRAVGREPARDRPPDPAATAGDDGAGPAHDGA